MEVTAEVRRGTEKFTNTEFKEYHGEPLKFGFYESQVYQKVLDYPPFSLARCGDGQLTPCGMNERTADAVWNAIENARALANGDSYLVVVEGGLQEARNVEEYAKAFVTELMACANWLEGEVEMDRENYSDGMQKISITYRDKDPEGRQAYLEGYVPARKASITCHRAIYNDLKEISEQAYEKAGTVFKSDDL